MSGLEIATLIIGCLSIIISIAVIISMVREGR